MDNLQSIVIRPVINGYTVETTHLADGGLYIEKVYIAASADEVMNLTRLNLPKKG